MSTPTKIRRGLAVALAAAGLAVGVPAAIAAGGTDDAATTAPTDAPAFIQDAQEGQAQPREDCPEGEGGTGAGSGSGYGEQGSATPDPSV